MNRVPFLALGFLIGLGCAIFNGWGSGARFSEPATVGSFWACYVATTGQLHCAPMAKVLEEIGRGLDTETNAETESL